MKEQTQKKLAAEHKEIELESNAWPRFERFIRDIAKAGPQHRTSGMSAKPTKSMTPKGVPAQSKKRQPKK